jgi:hypothetical protein
MKTLIPVLLCLAAGTMIARGQDPNAVRIDVKKVDLGVQQTPQMQAPNLVDKRWKPKNWLELEAQLDIKLAPVAGGRKGSLDAMQVKYFIALNQKDDQGKNIVLSGTIDYKNIPADQTAIALAFVAPSTLKRVLMKDNGGKNDVAAYGIEVLVGGERLAFNSSQGGPWWHDPATQSLSNKFTFDEGSVLPKSKTPFAPFWGDYDLPVAGNP